jgi:uncharacterized membrane protein YebE (DUF533 family)
MDMQDKTASIEDIKNFLSENGANIGLGAVGLGSVGLAGYGVHKMMEDIKDIPKPGSKEHQRIAEEIMAKKEVEDRGGYYEQKDGNTYSYHPANKSEKNTMKKTSAVQSFNRIDDPVIDQDNAKLLGALGGGYAGWKQHGRSVAKRKSIFNKMLGKASSPVMKPGKALVGAGLGALAAGTLARYMNKENKEDHQEAMARAQAMQAPQYPMYSYASEDWKDEKLAAGAASLGAGTAGISAIIKKLLEEKGSETFHKGFKFFGDSNQELMDEGKNLVAMGEKAGYGVPIGLGIGAGALGLYGGKKIYDHFSENEKTANVNMGGDDHEIYNPEEKTKQHKFVGKGIRGGLLGALASAILGGKLRTGAALGALAGGGHEAYKQWQAKEKGEANQGWDNQYSAPSQTEQLAMYDPYNNYSAVDKYASEVSIGNLARDILMEKKAVKLSPKAFMHLIGKGKTTGKVVAKGSKKYPSFDPTKGYKSKLDYEMKKGM